MRKGTVPSESRAPHPLAKAIVGGTSLMVALQDRRLQADDPASKYIPAWRADPQKSRITIRHLATHTSGIEDAEQDDIDHASLPGWKGVFWKREPDPFSIAVHQAPVIFAPGSSYAYSNPGMADLAYAVTASLKGTPQTDIHALLKARIMEPLGIPESNWSIGYGRTYEVDGLQLYANWGGGLFTPRATARIGQLMLHQGVWDGKRLFDRALVQRMTSYAGLPIQTRNFDRPGPASGLGWWVNFDGVWPNVPRDAFAGAGAGQELLLGSSQPRPGRGAQWRVDGSDGAFLARRRRQCVRSRRGSRAQQGALSAECRHSRCIVRSANPTILRQAIESDNWPITWGDDDEQYTAYGDGAVSNPTSITNSVWDSPRSPAPRGIPGDNIRSNAGERLGDGA